MNDADKLQADVCPVCGHQKSPLWAKIAGLLVIGVVAVLALSAVVWLIALIWRNV